eukprot:SAG11_NODE_38493_length_252_cov_0.673203_1_plen_29_part_10
MATAHALGGSRHRTLQQLLVRRCERDAET